MNIKAGGMKNKTATLIGATGLIGGHVLELLQNDPVFGKIKVLSRRPLNYSNPVIEVVVIDFSDQKSFKAAVSGSDVIFCAVGTTNKKVKGDKNAYRKVDYDIPVNAARFGQETGCESFVVVSSMGANSASNNFYIRLKGEVEDTIGGFNLPALHIFQPSLLMGKRQEFRLGERIGEMIMKPLSFLIPSKMKPVDARNVARAMVAASKLKPDGREVYQYNEIMQLIR